MKYIHFEIIIIIILLLISSTCCIIKKLPTTNEIQIANCIVTTAKQSFLDTTNLHLIINNQENHQNIIRILYKHFSLSIESEIIPKKFTTKFMIIEDNQQTLRERFNEPSISKYYEYLIITKISTLTELLSLTNFFYEREFYSSVFIFISLENTTIVQFQSRPRNNNEIYHSIECDEKFLNDKNENLIRRFDRFVCPPTECSLTYWNLVSEAPNNLTYKVYENGTVMAYSIGADMLEEFAKIYEIQITRDLNHSIVDTSWNEGVNAILNDTIDVLFGFAMPTSRDVESLMVSTWNRFYFLGLLYVPEYNYRSTGLGSFFIPMEFDVWICFAFVIIFYSFFTLGVRYVYRKKLIREFLKASDLLRIFLKQDVGDTKNGGLRLIMGLMLLYGLLITTAYESMITSSFISKSPPILLNTLTEVCESNRRFGGPTFIHQFIDNSAYVCSRNFYDSYEEVNVTTIIDLMHFEKAIMMHNVDINNFAMWVYRDRFNHRTSQQPFAYYPSLFFTKPRQSYNSLLKHFVLHFHSAGLETRLQDYYKIGHKVCETCEDETSSPLTISHLSFCWFSLFIGWVISCTILAIEFVFSKVHFLLECSFK